MLRFPFRINVLLPKPISRRTFYFFMSAKGVQESLSGNARTHGKVLCNGVYSKNGSSSKDNSYKTGSGVVDLEKLSEEEKEIYYLHKAACEEGKSMYNDPTTGYAVFTETFHHKRGSCCANACRHCPFSHKNVPESQRTKKFNSAFYF